MQKLRFGRGKVISSYILLNVWILIHAGNKFNNVSKRVPRSRDSPQSFIPWLANADNENHAWWSSFQKRVNCRSDEIFSRNSLTVRERFSNPNGTKFPEKLAMRSLTSCHTVWYWLVSQFIVLTMHTILLCFALLWLHYPIIPFVSFMFASVELNLTIVPALKKYPWRIWVQLSIQHHLGKVLCKIQVFHSCNNWVTHCIQKGICEQYSLEIWLVNC